MGRADKQLSANVDGRVCDERMAQIVMSQSPKLFLAITSL